MLSSGLMSFPLTDFDAAGEFDEAGYRARLEWLMPYGATVLFAAGGTGEAFSLTPAEQARIVRVAVETCGSRHADRRRRGLRHAARDRDGAGGGGGGRGRACC